MKELPENTKDKKSAASKAVILEVPVVEESFVPASQPDHLPDELQAESVEEEPKEVQAEEKKLITEEVAEEAVVTEAASRLCKSTDAS